MTATVLFAVINAAILILALFAIIHGSKCMKISRSLSTESKRGKFGFCFASGLHMCTGICIVTCYGIVGLLYLLV